MKLSFTVADTTAVKELKQHHMRVSKICEGIARALKMTYSDLIKLLLAAQLHDIGKLWIPQQILDKPEKLNEKEVEIVKKHVFYGYEYVKKKKKWTAALLRQFYTITNVLTGGGI